MNNAKQVLGQEGERVAERYLQKKGYKLVERNYRCPAGEVDLIVLDRRVIVFVEVKTRTGNRFGSPLEAVQPRKQHKMIRAAQFFLAQKGLHQRDARFDVVGISWPARSLSARAQAGQAGGPAREPVVEHVENAFELS